MTRDPAASRADTAYRRLKDKIRSGELGPGDRMREIDLATRLDVSRTPIREAINRLASEGLVELAPSRGVMITRLDKQQVRELYALRGSLEGTAASLAAQVASADEIANMQRLLEIWDREELPSAGHARLNRLFHAAIHEAAHNRYLARALEQLADSLALLPGTTFEAEGRAAEARQEHRAIADAISARDPESADRLARLHIHNAGRVRLSMMFEREHG